nr:zinc finger, CCHC-type, viral movement protein [Tanacetum cinerariifolium]
MYLTNYRLVRGRVSLYFLRMLSLEELVSDDSVWGVLGEVDEAAKIDDDEDLPTKQKSSQQKLKKRYEKEDKKPNDYRSNKACKQNQPAEATVNWQSENANAKNKVLVKILSKQSMITISQEYLSSRVRSLESIIKELRFKIQELNREIIQIIRTSPTTQHFSSISQKEAEMKNLKNQLQDLEQQHKQIRITSLIDDPWRLPLTPIVGVSFDPQPLPQSYTHTTLPSLNIWASEQRRLKPSAIMEPTLLQESQSIADVVTSTKTPDVLPIQKENPNQETPIEFPKSEIKQYFTFDDLPPSKWHERRIEMLTWCTAELQYYTIDVVIKRFLTRFQGRLRDWYHSLGEYQSLGNEEYRDLEARNVTISQTTLGELYQLILNVLAKLYNHKKFLSEFKRTRKHLGTACDDNYLQIKCKDKSSCDCTHTKKKFHSKIFLSLSGASFAKRGHFARNYSNKKISQALIHALNQVEPIDVSDLESLYSLDDEPSDSVLCTIAHSDLSSDDDSDTDLPENYYWKPHHQNFMAANGEKFVIDKISVPINIRLFPKCVIKRRLLGSSSHGKDLLIGFDILHKLPNLRWTGEGLHYRSFFNPWTAMHRLFVANITPPIFNINSIKQRLIQTCCASSDTEFLTEHPSPLRLNPSFFVSLPFKQNEDVNPTKAIHPGMNPDHYQLAKEECEQLVSQGIIKPTTSPWACEAFYINKRREQVRGKLRLVINYQPLNNFLADDKFPLPQKKSVFQHLADARVLSKFDLKFGFWQFSIKPEDRPKTAFCIPDHHYRWKSHAGLLSKFYSLVTKYGIMLSEKKMEVGVTTIQFLGKEFSDGKYSPNHILSLSSKAYKLEGNYPKDAGRVQNHTLKFLSMVFSVVSHKEEGSSSNTTPTIPVFDLPEEKNSYQQWTRWITTIGKGTYVLVMFRRPRSFLPPKAVNDDGSVVYYAPYFFIHDKYKVNPSSRRCERKLQTLYTDTRSLMTRANGVDPDKIPYHIMWNISIWSKDHPDAYKWIEANRQWLYDNFDHCEVETSDDDDDAWSLWSLDDNEHFDPFEDDLTHLDARWSP